MEAGRLILLSNQFACFKKNTNKLEIQNRYFEFP